MKNRCRIGGHLSLLYRNSSSQPVTKDWSRHLASLVGAAEPSTSSWPGQALWRKSDPTKWWWEHRFSKIDRNIPDYTTEEGLSQPEWVDGGLGVPGSSGPWKASDQHELDTGADLKSQRVARRRIAAEEMESWSRLCDRQLNEAVDVLDRLVLGGSPVPDIVYYHAIKGCITNRDLVAGRRVHALTHKSGNESKTYVANNIIRMYASHGRLQEAMQVFTRLAEPDTFSWFFIILAHTDHGKPEDAINLYHQMRRSTVKPDNHTFVAVLKACSSLADLTSGKQVHADVLGSVVKPDVFVGNSLVDMYAKCGKVEDAREVFDKMPTKNVVTWNALVGGYVQQGLGQEALALYACMQEQDITSANHLTFVCLLKACASVGALREGKELHAQIQKGGFEAHVMVGSSLVGMYAKCGSLSCARQVFDMLPTRNVVTWTAMIAGYAQHGSSQEAIALYTEMQQEGIAAGNLATFVSLLKAFTNIRALQQGKDLHLQIQKRGLEGNMVIGSCLVDMYARCGSLDDARRLFDRLPSRDTVTWNSMISGYAEQGLGQEALDLYRILQQECTTTPSQVTYVCLLKACASVGALHVGKQIHSRIQESAMETDLVVGNCLVDMYGKCGSLEDARKVFDRLPKKDVITWTALLNAYGQHNESLRAIQCFTELQQSGLIPNDATFTCLLCACSHEGLVFEARRYFKMMVEDYGIAPTVDHYNCMVDLLGRSGHLDDAENLLQTMPLKPDVVGWRSLLNACKMYADVERGERCFQHLVKLEPKAAAAYVLLANIYANAGRWRDAERVESLRKSVGAGKKPAKAWIEVKSEVHGFVVGEERVDVSSKLRSVNERLKEEGGHVPQTELVLKPLSDREKEDALCGHAEKLALAYGLLNTPDGTPLLVTKNLRMCDDCHTGTKIMSRTEQREIVVRDAHRVHRFVNGFCSCGDRY